MDLRELLGLAALYFGIAFSIIGVIGMIRLPDVYTRLHASGKVSTLGLWGILLGAAFLLEGVLPRALALAVFLVLVQPIASHAIAAAARRSGVPLSPVFRDDMPPIDSKAEQT
ncbi:MAG: Na+/H+ antiporter subunit G [Candidatus Thermofonsia Clade 1 bacterium]|uniref:Na+/H+ antiporter subunit G n=1 Tax=Candidatus Thermofonsia Clade 1 bacterium TaxID=2364210 RepID=A0A2M8P3L0_9CHLR|nr:MAG: Na+/H+ antiporter subunit G [Candidatus Thermofonsia Clade 1 bacterium]